MSPTDNIQSLLPQRPPFILVDKLTYFDLKSAATVFTVREDHLFCTGGVMEEAGLVENMAQTCAARTGFKQRLENEGFTLDAGIRFSEQRIRQLLENKRMVAGTEIKYGASAKESVKIGMLVMISLMEIKRRPLAGEILKTSMVIEEEFFSTTFVRSEVMIGDETIATCRMKLFLTDKIPDHDK